MHVCMSLLLIPCTHLLLTILQSVVMSAAVSVYHDAKPILIQKSDSALTNV